MSDFGAGDGGPRSRPFIPVPGSFFGSDRSVLIVRRGSERHIQFFNFLRDRNHLDWWLSEHPDFLPLAGDK
jgi:hypothetical protein